CLQSDNMPLTF
nr:immunoglobulin light chain junction region [Mus musculus]NSL97099.1 immunoglobulin light chain junction region [Mus musculus]NSL97117.1 immunoglobulin light chain junction region [Mus musculus]NSL97124.1 immunoglobulin light chain junction region [Mus musculus]NSL97125.1 immunoglobulin light chain junction region [Mus musculus]